MEGIPTWLLLLGALPAAWLGFKLMIKGMRRLAYVWVTIEKAAKIILYELVPNEGHSLKDTATEALRVARENQRALELHMTEGHQIK